MSEMYVDVDTAITVPVNVFPLTDDTDFKTRETGIVYNQAGMDLVWNFQTTAGVTTQTAVTPTTAGVYDWTHSGDGMYKIEIPASGGGSINNDSEGTGWFTGFATGVLPWRGPMILFRAAGINNLLIDDAHSATRGLAGTALPAAAADAAGGLIVSDAGGLDIDAMNTNINDIETDTAAMQPLVAKIPLSDGTITWNSTALASINAEADTAISDASLATAANLSTVDSNVDAILVDTGTTLPATLTTIDGKIDTVDTNVDSILVDTAEIGVAGAGLTAINLPNQTMDISGNITGSLSGSVGSVTGSVGSVVGHTPQTGDNFARIGVAGASLTDITINAASVDAIWDENIISAHTTVDTAGKILANTTSLSTGAGGISTTAVSATVTTGSETLTYTSTTELDGTTHDIAPSVGNTEFYYEFNVGITGVATEILWEGHAESNGDSYTIKGYDWVSAGWKTIGTITASNSTAVIEQLFIPTLSMTGTGANDGVVRCQVTSADGTNFSTDRILCQYTSLAEEALVLHSGVAQAGGSNTITLDTSANSNDDFYNHTKILIASGTGDEQERIIIDYNGTTKVATIAPPWITIPDSTSAFEVEPGLTHAETGWATIKVGLAAAGASTTITLDSLASSVDDFYNNDLIYIDAGTGEGQVRVITDYVGSTKVATIHTAWITTPDTTSEYIVQEAHPYTDTKLSTMDTKIDTVDTNVDAILVDTGTTLPGTLTTIEGKVDTVDTNVDSVLVDTAEIGTAGAGLTDLGGMSTAMKSEVNTEVVDTLNTDTYSELSSVPAATSTLVDKINWLFIKARNKITQTSTTQLIRNDADSGTVGTSTVSDDTTTATRGEYS